MNKKQEEFNQRIVEGLKKISKDINKLPFFHQLDAIDDFIGFVENKEEEGTAILHNDLSVKPFSIKKFIKKEK